MAKGRNIHQNGVLKRQEILGIDPGKNGAIVFMDGVKFKSYIMPLKENKDVDFRKVVKVLKQFNDVHVVLERAMPFSMGMKSAFNYGRDFKTLELAIELCKNPVTYVEPRKWTKEMCQGIKLGASPKVRSQVAAERLYPKEFALIPKGPRSKKPHDGVIDALLIAGYGIRKVL